MQNEKQQKPIESIPTALPPAQIEHLELIEKMRQDMFMQLGIPADRMGKPEAPYNTIEQ